jgi:hypothetical protein
MADVAVENHSQVKQASPVNKIVMGESGPVYAVVCKPMHKLVSTKVIAGAESLRLLSMERMELLLAYSFAHKITISSDFLSNCAGACGGFFFQIVAKHPCQTGACELIILALCCTCSLQMYQFYIRNDRQMETNDNLDVLFSEKARDKSSALPCC